MLLLDPVRRTVAAHEVLRQKAERQLVAEAWRVEEVAQLRQPASPGADLLGELPGGADLGRLAGDVELAGRQLEQGSVDRSPVLADEQDVLAVALERHHADSVEGPDDLALERETVRA